MFATILNRLLLEEITDNIKFKKDDFKTEDKSIVDNCFKARGLSFEYFINKIIMDNLKLEALPRVFFGLNDSKRELEELDGVFYTKSNKILNTKLFPFIEEEILKKMNIIHLNLKLKIMVLLFLIIIH